MKKSMIEVAYQVLTNNNGSMPFVDLWKDVSQEMGFNQTQFEDNIAQFYTDLSLDGRFLNMSQNTWDLRSRHTYSESVMDTDSIAIDEDDEDEEDSELIEDELDEVEKEMDEKAMEILKVFDLDKEADTLAGNLPYGKQRKLEIARALATNPKLLLLDEPAAGMNPNETGELMDMIRFVRDEFHMTILLIEHDMSLVMGICEGIAVLNFGRIIAKGTPDEIRNNPQVIEAYLGKKEG